MVVDFEEELTQSGTKEENEFFSIIKTTLTQKLGRAVDLEAVFSVVDGIIHYNIERLGLLSVFVSSKVFEKNLINTPFGTKDVNTCRSLKNRFESFVRKRCANPGGDLYHYKISDTYQDFFNRIWNESEERNDDYLRTSNKNCYVNGWTMFTTNYDTCLEHYWHGVARGPLYTGFSYKETTNRKEMDQPPIFDKPLNLIKLH
jgi:hypothetical protein